MSRGTRRDWFHQAWQQKKQTQSPVQDSQYAPPTPAADLDRLRGPLRTVETVRQGPEFRQTAAGVQFYAFGQQGLHLGEQSPVQRCDRKGTDSLHTGGLRCENELDSLRRVYHMRPAVHKKSVLKFSKIFKKADTN